MSILSSRLTLCIVATHFLISCGGGSEGNSSAVIPPSDGSSFDGSVAAISNIYGQSQIDALEQIGLTFNLGDQPPNIEGSYRFNNRVLQATTVPGDERTAFVSSTITFSNQNNSTLSVEYLGVEDEGTNAGTTSGTGSFISGVGQSFTVYVVSESTIDGNVANTTATISGVVTNSGIENIQFAGFMLDNRGNTENFIPNDTGRLIIDSDGLTERLSVDTPLAESRVRNTLHGGYSP